MDDFQDELDSDRRIRENGYEDSWRNPTHVDYEFYHGDYDDSPLSDSEAAWFKPALIIVGLGLACVITMRFLYY